LKQTVKNMEAQMARMSTLEKDIRDVAQGVVCMSDNMVLNNEILKRNITSDIKTNLEQSTLRNNEALIVSMSQLMSEQTAKIENRMESKWEQNDKMYESLQDALDKKLEKTTRSLKKLLDTSDTSRKIITKHQSKARVSRSLSRLQCESLDDSMDNSLYDKENNTSGTACHTTASHKKPC
jgi:actin-related protein